MNVYEAQIAARALNLDGGEGSGVKGHTTAREPRSVVAARIAAAEKDLQARIAAARAPKEPHEHVLAAARDIASRSGGEVRVAQLRQQVPLQPHEFEHALNTLHESGRVALYRDDNPKTAEKNGAHFVGGSPRHVLYVK